MMPTFWARMRSLFAVDDGSLPEICIRRLNPAQISGIYALLRAPGTQLVGAPLVHDMTERCDKPLASLENPAEQVVQARFEPFHFLVRGLRFGDRGLPDLGVFILPDAVVLDYQPGLDWKESQVLALFELLRRVRGIAPLAAIELGDISDPAAPGRFDEAFNDFCRRNPPSAPPASSP